MLTEWEGARRAGVLEFESQLEKDYVPLDHRKVSKTQLMINPCCYRHTLPGLLPPSPVPLPSVAGRTTINESVVEGVRYCVRKRDFN